MQMLAHVALNLAATLGLVRRAPMLIHPLKSSETGSSEFDMGRVTIGRAGPKNDPSFRAQPRQMRREANFGVGTEHLQVVLEVGVRQLSRWPRAITNAYALAGKVFTQIIKEGNRVVFRHSTCIFNIQAGKVNGTAFNTQPTRLTDPSTIENQAPLG